MVKAHPRSDIKKGRPPRRRAKIAKRVDASDERINIRKLRKALAAAIQVTAPDKANLAQSELPRLVKEADYRFSTLRRYVEGMGAKLEASVVIKGKKFALYKTRTATTKKPRPTRLARRKQAMKNFVKAGWRVGTVAEFLGLTPAEEARIETKLAARPVSPRGGRTRRQSRR